MAIDLWVPGQNVGCLAGCRSARPQVTSAGQSEPGSDVKAKKPDRISTRQVTYFGHPRYYFLYDRLRSGRSLVHPGRPVTRSSSSCAAG
jgi:hypothetical protein